MTKLDQILLNGNNIAMVGAFRAIRDHAVSAESLTVLCVLTCFLSQLVPGGLPNAE